MTVLPELEWVPTPACGDRHGHPVSLVVVHRWGVKYVNLSQEEKTYHGVVNFFTDPRHGASAHVVFPGSADPGKATQMVSWDKYAWAEAAYNPSADEFESADDIWMWKDHDTMVDEQGFKTLARMVAFRLHARSLPPVWSNRRGFCRHADLGAAGGGHTQCPTTDIRMWRKFIREVQANFPWTGREVWGR